MRQQRGDAQAGNGKGSGSWVCTGPDLAENGIDRKRLRAGITRVRVRTVSQQSLDDLDAIAVSQVAISLRPFPHYSPALAIKILVRHAHA